MRQKEVFWAICYWVLASLQAIRLIRMVAVYGVNLLFMDEWDVFDPLFNRAPNDWYDLFFVKHTHGEGLGLVLEAICNYWSRWDTRVEGLFICCLFVLTFLVYTAIRRRFGPYTWFDLIWPILCLTPLHFEAILVVPHLAYGPVPALLIALTAYFWLMSSSWLRDGALILLTFLTVYTGYGCFLGGFSLLFFGSEVYFQLRDRNYAVAARKLGATLIVLGMLGRFFATCDLFSYNATITRPPLSWDYVFFVLRMFSHAAGLSHPLIYFIDDGIHPEIFGLVMILPLLMIIGTQLKAYFYERDQLAFVLFALALFTLIYTVLTCYGRMFLGLDSAYSSRYVAYMLPGTFVLYLFLAVKLRSELWRWRLQMGVLVLVVQGGSFLTDGEVASIGYYQDNKRKWVTNYLRTRSAAEADRLTDFPLHPNPTAAHLEEKLQFLREHHLNLFKDSR